MAGLAGPAGMDGRSVLNTPGHSSPCHLHRSSHSFQGHVRPWRPPPIRGSFPGETGHPGPKAIGRRPTPGAAPTTGSTGAGCGARGLPSAALGRSWRHRLPGREGGSVPPTPQAPEAPQPGERSLSLPSAFPPVPTSGEPSRGRGGLALPRHHPSPRSLGAAAPPPHARATGRRGTGRDGTRRRRCRPPLPAPTAPGGRRRPQPRGGTAPLTHPPPQGGAPAGPRGRRPGGKRSPGGGGGGGALPAGGGRSGAAGRAGPAAGGDARGRLSQLSPHPRCGWALPAERRPLPPAAAARWCRPCSPAPRDGAAREGRARGGCCGAPGRLCGGAAGKGGGGGSGGRGGGRDGTGRTPGRGFPPARPSPCAASCAPARRRAPRWGAAGPSPAPGSAARAAPPQAGSALEPSARPRAAAARPQHLSSFLPPPPPSPPAGGGGRRCRRTRKWGRAARPRLPGARRGRRRPPRGTQPPPSGGPAEPRGTGRARPPPRLRSPCPPPAPPRRRRPGSACGRPPPRRGPGGKYLPAGRRRVTVRAGVTEPPPPWRSVAAGGAPPPPAWSQPTWRAVAMAAQRWRQSA